MNFQLSKVEKSYTIRSRVSMMDIEIAQSSLLKAADRKVSGIGNLPFITLVDYLCTCQYLNYEFKKI